MRVSLLRGIQTINLPDFPLTVIWTNLRWPELQMAASKAVPLILHELRVPQPRRILLLRLGWDRGVRDPFRSSIAKRVGTKTLQQLAS
jgi:hypothetical protein